MLVLVCGDGAVYGMVGAEFDFDLVFERSFKPWIIRYLLLSFFRYINGGFVIILLGALTLQVNVTFANGAFHPVNRLCP